MADRPQPSRPDPGITEVNPDRKSLWQWCRKLVRR